jgi:hypothetical protein
MKILQIKTLSIVVFIVESICWLQEIPGHYRKPHPIILLCLVASLIFSTGCGSFIADREQGFNMIQRGFSQIEPTPDLYKEVELKNVKIIIVGDRKQFKWKKAVAEGSPIIGYATPNNEIWVFGKEVNGKIVLNEAILGHELVHLLNFKNSIIVNPDKLNNLNLD